MPDTTITNVIVQPKTAEVTQNPMDGNYLLILLLIMVIMGCLGGLANYLNSKKEEQHFWRSIVMGVVATFSIPLFLKIVDSNLISEDVNLHSYLVFAGFCVLAAFYSGKFLEGLSGRVLQNLQKKVEENSNKIEETSVKTDFLVDTQLVSKEDDESNEGSKGIDYNQLNQDFSPAEQIEAAFKSSSRNVQTLESLMKKTGLSAEEVQKELDVMVKSGKVEEVPHKNGKIYGMVS